jgi:hypothetical protein
LISVLIGLGPVVTIQAVTLVPPDALGVPECPLPVAEPHAASSRLAMAPAAAAGHFRRVTFEPDRLGIADMDPSWSPPGLLRKI